MSTTLQTKGQPMTATAEQTGLSVTANRGELVDCLAAVALATKARTPQEVLKCVRLTTTADAMEMETTDLAVRIRRVARIVQTHAPAVTCVPCDEILSAAKMADGEVVELTVAGSILTLAGTSSRRTLYTQDASNFPPTPTDDADLATFTLKAGDLKAAWGFVAHSVADEGTRYAMKGVLFDREGKRLVLVTTDSKRLSRVVADATVTGDESNVIVPVEAMTAASRAIGDDDTSEVLVAVAASTVRITCDDATVWSARIEGAFPPWRDILFSDAKGVAKVDRESFLDAVRRGGSAWDEISDRMTVEVADGGFAFTLNNPKRGNSDARYPCKFDGEDIRIGLNPQKVIDALAGMPADELMVEWNAPNRPVKFTCGDAVEILMPMNLNV